MSAKWDEVRRAESAAMVLDRSRQREAVLRGEAERMAAMIRLAAPPPVCGPDIPVAPARGCQSYRVFQPVEMVPGSTDRIRPAGYRAPGEDRFRSAVHLLDAFDRMEAAALRSHLDRGGAREAFRPPFSPGQVAAGRRYRDLVERQEAGAVRCASIETRVQGVRVQGGDRDFIDARIVDAREVAAMRRRIGPGLALEPRRGGSKMAISLVDLVDAVCRDGMDLTEVLKAWGWSAWGGNRSALRHALASALDRMQGYA